MSLPDGWRCVALKELGEVLGGLTYSPSNVCDSGLLVLRSSNVQNGQLTFNDNVYVNLSVHDDSMVRESDILICVRNGSRDLIGKNALITRDCPKATAGAFMALFRGPFNKFVYHLFQTETYRRQVQRNLGATINSINGSDLRCFEFIVPPESEREKIAEILTCWDKAIELVERLIEEKRTLKRSLAQRIFFSKHRPNTSEDSEWITVELRHLLEVSKDKGPISESRPLFSLTIEHGVTPKTDRYDREALVKDKVAKLYKVVNPMDIVFNPSNLRWGAIGLCREKTPVLVSPIYEVVRVKDPESTSTEFLFQLLSSERQINFFATLTEGTLIERMAVKVDTFLDQTVCIPSRREDQDALAAILSLADREISSLGQLGSALKDQKRGLMQQLLTGKMRVRV